MMGSRKTSALPSLFLVLLAAAAASVSSSRGFKIVVEPKEPKVKDTVVLKIVGFNERIRYSDWYRGNIDNSVNQILRFDTSQINGNRYFKEARGSLSGSLTIVNVRKEFEGNYTVAIQGDSSRSQETVFLRVYEEEGEQDINSQLFSLMCRMEQRQQRMEQRQEEALKTIQLLREELGERLDRMDNALDKALAIPPWPQKPREGN